MKKRVLSGNRPTGKLHIGHFHGALKNWIKLQDEYDCFFFVADWHALTTNYDNVVALKSDIQEMVIDWLALGLDPQKSVIYKQSDIPEVAELSLYLSMITPLGWLERCPTYKEQLQELKEKDIATHGFLGYPVLQAADILIVHSDFVPVGEDQLPHLELSREIARRFNYLYGDCFSEPQALLTEVKRLPGIDGRKMSKSYGNAIFLSDSPDEIRNKVRMMITDPQRIKLTDKGHPEVCTVFAVHKAYSQDVLEEIEAQCRGATRGCTECKGILAEKIAESLTGFREKRAKLVKETEIVQEVLKNGANQARPIAQDALHEVRKRMNIE